MVYKSGASTSSEPVEKIDDISKKSSAHGGQRSDDESTANTSTSTALPTNTRTPPKIDNGINFESKRKLRTSRRLNSLNPDLLPPLLLHDKTSDSAPSSNHQPPSQTKSSGPVAAVTLAQPLGAPKPIRNRRYTINECSNATGLRDAKDETVPFQAKNKQETIVLNNCLTTTTTATSAAAATATAPASSKSDQKSSCDDLNLLGDRLNCSVSLERLTGIIDTLVYQTNVGNDTDKDDANGGTNKILCLYCDRTFSSQKLYGKHLERLHQSTSGRRSSARTSNSESAGITYPGCFYCNPGKVAPLSGADLMQLVHHLVDEHRDKYFACKSCMIRYPSRDQLQQHLSKEHKIDNNRRKSSSLAKRNAKKVQSSADVVDGTTSADAVVAPNDGIVADEIATANEPTQRSLRLRRSNDAGKKSSATIVSNPKPQLLTTEETFLSRLGIAQNRSPRSRKGAKNRRGCSSELFPLETTRASRTNKNSKSTQQNLVSETVEFNAPKVSNNKSEPVASVFDEDFYESVNLNVKLNLSCHLDGKLETDGEEESGSGNGGNQSAVDVPAVRSILVKSPVFAEAEIHEATTTISAFTAFPTLLTAQQYGAEFQAGKMKKPITKNSWKWKWDCVKKYKYVNEGGKIVKKVKQPLAGLRDLSKLDMWTQLTMRTKHESVARQENELGGGCGFGGCGDESGLAVGEAAREEKRKLIAQLNQILDKRVLPQINVEQSDQTIIKIELAEELAGTERTLLTHLSGSDTDDHDIVRDFNFPASLRLFKCDQGAHTSKSPIVLSGEWARPRCYICVSCGSRFSTVRSLEEHKASKHPFVHSTHYEIVGKELIDGNLFRNFYIPSMALQRHSEHIQTTPQKPFFGSNVLCGGDDSMDSVTSYSLSITKSDSIDLDSSSRNSKVSVSSTGTATSSSLTASNSIDDENANNAVDNAISGDAISATASSVKCSKCNRECNGTMDLYRHMLDCSSDYAWLLAKKRNHIKYRYFGSRRRRTHRNSMSNSRKPIKPKKERDAASDGASSASKSKEPTTPRPRPSDAESIQRMLANLPAKRAARQIFPNLTPKPVKSKKFGPNAIARGGKILVKQKTAGGNTRSYKILSTSTTINTVGANLVLRKRRSVDQQLRLKRSTDAAGIVTIRRTRATAAENSKSVASGSRDSVKKMVGVGQQATRKDGKGELGNVIRRRATAVVKKITSTFRQGNRKHLIRTPTASASDKGTAGDPGAGKSNEPQKKRKLLRSISFRRSSRNIRKSEPSKLPRKTVSGDEKPVPMDEATKTTDSEKPADEQTVSESPVSDVIVVDAPKTVAEEKAADPVTEPASEPPPKLKRKRSIKTIINDIRAKCQGKANAKATEATDEPTAASTPLPTVVEVEAKPPPIVEPSPAVMPTPQVSVTSPLSLTIESNDEPLDLCVASRQRNQVVEMVTPTASSLPVPATTPVSASQQSESISPRRRTRKINDCIAMLTGKLQEKLGVPFIDQSLSLLAVLGSDAPPKDQPQAPSTSTEPLPAPQEQTMIDEPAVVPPVELPSIVESTEPMIDVPIEVPIEEKQPLPEPQISPDPPSQPNEEKDEIFPDANSEIDKIDSKEANDEKAIDRHSPIETIVATVVNAAQIDAPKSAVPGGNALEIAVEIPSKETKDEIDTAIDPSTEEMPDETIATTLEPVVEAIVGVAVVESAIAESVVVESVVVEPAKEDLVPGEVIPAKKAPNRKQKSTAPKAKAAKSSKKAAKKLEVVAIPAERPSSTTDTSDEIRVNEEPKGVVVVTEQISDAADKEPTAIPPEINVSCVETEPAVKVAEAEQKPEEPIGEPADAELPPVEASVDAVITGPIEIVASAKTTTPKSRKTASNAKQRASTTTKPVEIPVSGDKSSPEIAEKVVPLPDVIPSVDKIETPPPKATSKDNKKPPSSVKRKTPAAPKAAKVTKSNAKAKVVPPTESKSSDENPPKSKRATPSSKKSQAPAVDSIFESSDEELLPWDPETGFVANQSDAKEPDAEEPDAKEPDPTPSQTPSSIAAPPTPTPSIAAPPTPTPPIADKPIVDPRPKKKRKNELAQIIADQLLESFKEVDQSRISELKKIHDLSLSSSDDLLTTSLSTTPTPRRKSKKIIENIETKSRTISPKVDARKIPEVKTTKEPAKESAMESVTAAVEVPPTEESKEVEPPKSTKGRSKQHIEHENEAEAAPPSPPIEPEAIAIAEDGESAIVEAPATAPAPKIIENVENVPKKSSGNIFLDGFSETLFSDADKEHLKATIDGGGLISKTATIGSDTPTTTMTAANATLKAPVIFGESLFTQQNLKTARLSDLIGGANNIIVDMTAKVSPMKNKSIENLISFDKLGEIKTNARAPFMSPRWDSNATDDKTEIKNKVNFWSRSIGDDKNAGANQKSRLFAVIKNKAEKMFTKMSKKKLKKSLKASISSSSSSSTSSMSSMPPNPTPKRPLLRPSILSCNSKRSEVNDDEEKALENIPKTMAALSAPPTSPKKTPSDIFDLHIAPAAAIQPDAVPLAARMIGSIGRKTVIVTETAEMAVDPKSPIESDMNIAKIVIALEKSNRKNSADESLLNNAFIATEHRASHAPFKEQKQQPPKPATHVEFANSKMMNLLDVEKSATPTPPLRIPAPTHAPPSITTDLLNDSSQDTMLSEIVSKIREKVNRTDSDDELCLTDVAKGLTDRSPSVEFDLMPRPKVNDFSNLQSTLSAAPPSTQVSQDEQASEDDADTADDEQTNTELLDMDLEDNASEYTALSHDTSTTSVGGSKKRKRKKRSILSRRDKRRTKRRDDSFVLPADTYFCDVCRRSFKNQSGLTSHKTTITHIAKLSEQEFLEQQKSIEASPIEDDDGKSMANESAADGESDALPVQNDLIASLEPVASDLNRSASSSPADDTSSQDQTEQPQLPPNEMSCNFESVSSPEGNTCFNSTPKHTSAALTLSMNARMTLSQEQRLFYECCSMLKGSDRSTTTTATTTTTTTSSTVHENSKNELTSSHPITPKTNQHHANIAHSAQSPRSHPSPRPGIPTLDLNHFSDISSDSNPAYSCPQIPSSSKTQKVFSLDTNELAKTEADKNDVATRVSTIAIYQHPKGQSQPNGIGGDKVKGDAGQRNSSVIVRNYSEDTFSDMGDSFPSSQDASESENYAQTVMERTVHIQDVAPINNSMRSGHSSKVNDSGYSLTPVLAPLHPDSAEFRTCPNRSNFESSIHSTSSQSSSMSRPRTKAAMKGYEDLKVSIPTTGLDMQQALERSPNASGANSSKLATLADIALGNDVPVCLERSTYVCPVKPSKASPRAATEKSATKKSLAAEAKKAEALRLSGDLAPKGKKRSSKNTGHLLGFRERKKRPRPAAKEKAKNEKWSMRCAELDLKERDVYDFEETQDSVDTAITPLTHTRPSKLDSTEGGTKKVCDEPEDESSYSDRDDYYNFNSVSGSGTEDDGMATGSDSLKSLKSTKAGQLQKKCLIMGRIFRKAKTTVQSVKEKSDVEVVKPIPKKQLDEIFDNLRTSPIKTTSKATKERDVQKRPDKIANAPPPPAPAVVAVATSRNHFSSLDPLDECTAQAAIVGGSVKSRKSREVANLEAEWGMSMEQIKELIGVGKRKTQRRCASNRQNKFMETWSSDEYEEFHSTKDIIALIEEAEMKAKRTKARATKSINAKAMNNNSTTTTATATATVSSTVNAPAVNATVAKPIEQPESLVERNAATKTTETKNDKENSKKCKNKLEESEPKLDASNNKLKTKKTATFSGIRSDDSDFDEHWNKTAKRAKIRNRRRTIASREDMLEEEKPKTKPRSKAAKPTSNVDDDIVVSGGHKIAANVVMSTKVVPAATTTEKKREIVATDTSHVKQNASAAIVTVAHRKAAQPKPRRKRIASEMLYYWSSSSDEEFGRIKQSENEDGGASDIHIEQHGWIVGDSHKKLVTLLAHAKGKKIDDCAVKEAAHKKK